MPDQQERSEQSGAIAQSDIIAFRLLDFRLFFV